MRKKGKTASKKKVDILKNIKNPLDDPEEEKEELTPKEEYRENQKERGIPSKQEKKGGNLPRINMAFRVADLEHLQKMGRIAGVSMTEYVHRLIKVDMERQKEVVKKQEKLQEEYAKNNLL